MYLICWKCATQTRKNGTATFRWIWHLVEANWLRCGVEHHPNQTCNKKIENFHKVNHSFVAKFQHKIFEFNLRNWSTANAKEKWNMNKWTFHINTRKRYEKNPGMLTFAKMRSDSRQTHHNTLYWIQVNRCALSRHCVHSPLKLRSESIVFTFLAVVNALLR